MKKRSIKFWISFWSIAIIFLATFYFVLRLKNNRQMIAQVAGIFPIGDQYKSIANFSNYFLQQDNQERTFLLLFQNNMEIRPGGGFIGSFGIVKVKNGKITLLQVHDTGNFDPRIPNTVAPPYPMAETLGIKSWQLRDSNFSPDFPTNAQKAEEFYYMGQGQEKFDGIIGITTNVLTSFLKATGPIAMEGYPGTYADENAVIALEYQVEEDFWKQGIKRGDRKSIMNDLADAILKKVFDLSLSQKIELAKIVFEDLNRKDIQLHFKDPILQAQAEKSNWSGEVDQSWKQDFLMTSDANLGAYKTDLSIKRSLDYTVDLTGDAPKAVLKITYNHTATQKDFMTKNYLSYLRVYVPDGAWLTTSNNFDGAKFGTELGKKYFGAIVKVPLGTSKTVEINYTLPKEIAENYNLKIQKQPGINGVPVAVHVKNANGDVKDYAYTMDSDIVLNK